MMKKAEVRFIYRFLHESLQYLHDFNFYSGKNDGFFLEDDKFVKLKKNVKTEASKKKTNKDNREGQRERKKHAKAVYGKHVQGKFLLHF